MSDETTATLDGFFKDIYVGKTEDLVPDFAVLARDIKFDKQNKLGDEYVRNVRTKRPHGVTFAGGASAGTAYALNPALAGQTRAAKTQGSSFTLRENVAHNVIMRAQSSREAFGEATANIVKAMMDSAAFYREANLLYGGGNIGTVDSVAGTDWVITVASWSVGLWANMEGAAIDAYDGAGTKLNTTEALTVVAVDAATRTVTLSGADAVGATIPAGSVFVPLGAQGQWFSGLDAITSHGASDGPIFNIDPATNGLWLSNTYSNGSAAANFQTFNNAAAKVVGRGGLCDLTFYISHFTWADLNLDSTNFVEKNRRGDEKKFELGASSISYLGPNGMIRIVQHPMVKGGEAFGIALDYFDRVGSSDIHWGLDGSANAQKFWQQLPDNNGYQLRCHYDQALFPRELAKSVKITDIVNSTT